MSSPGLWGLMREGLVHLGGGQSPMRDGAWFPRGARAQGERAVRPGHPVQCPNRAETPMHSDERVAGQALAGCPGHSGRAAALGAASDDGNRGVGGAECPLLASADQSGGPKR